MTSGEVRANTALIDTGHVFAQTAARLYDTSARIGSEQMRAADQNGGITDYQPTGDWADPASWVGVPPPKSPAVGPIHGYGGPSYTGPQHRTPVEQPTDNIFPGFAPSMTPRPSAHQEHPSYTANPAVLEEPIQRRAPRVVSDRRSMLPEQVHGVAPANVMAYPLGAIATNVVVVPGPDGARQGAPLAMNQAYPPETAVRIPTGTRSVISGRAPVPSIHTAAIPMEQTAVLAANAPVIPHRGSAAVPRHVTTTDNFDRTTPGASSYGSLIARLDPPDTENGTLSADYGDIGNGDWYAKLRPVKRPAAYMGNTSEVIAAIRDETAAPARQLPAQPAQAPAPTTTAPEAKQTMTTASGEVIEMPKAIGLIADLNEPFDRKAVDFRNTGMLVPSQEILSSKADPKYRGVHAIDRKTERRINTYRGERVTKSHIVRVAAGLGSFIKKTVVYAPALAGYTLAGNEAYTHYLPMLLQR